MQFCLVVVACEAQHPVNGTRSVGPWMATGTSSLMSFKSVTQCHFGEAD